MTYEHSPELFHFGILGMKWGVRRFQKSNGHLTTSGKKRYSDIESENKGKKDSSSFSQKNGNSKIKISRKEKLVNSYIAAGLSKKQALKAANNRVRTEKILMVAAGVTVAACAAYVAHNHLKDQLDGVIKSGDSLQRIEMRDTGGKLNSMFYAAKGDHDSKRYRGLLGYTRQCQTGEAYLMKLTAQGDVRVASKNNAEKVFERLYKEDPEFRKGCEKFVGMHFTGQNRVNIENVSHRNMKKMYENFNSALIDIRNSKTGSDEKFYAALRKSGYGAIQDINDMKYSGYNAKNPLIIFDNSKGSIMVESVKKLTGSLGRDAAVEDLKRQGEAVASGFIKSGLPFAAIGTTGLAIKTRTSPLPKAKAKVKVSS